MKEASPERKILQGSALGMLAFGAFEAIKMFFSAAAATTLAIGAGWGAAVAGGFMALKAIGGFLFGGSTPPKAA